MKCPNCQFENVESAKFCNECGHQLSLPTKPIPRELSFEEKLQEIRKYLPGGLTEKSSRSGLGVQRSWVVLEEPFCYPATEEQNLWQGLKTALDSIAISY